MTLSADDKNTRVFDSPTIDWRLPEAKNHPEAVRLTIVDADVFFPVFPFPASHRASTRMVGRASLAIAIIFAASFALWSYLVTHI
jgi:hypothetical protein